MGVAGGRQGRFGLAVALAALATFVFGATQAFAATDVTYEPSANGSYMNVTDMTGDDDNIVVSVAGNTITIVDTGTGGITTADTDCEVKVVGTTVTCPFDPPDPAPPAPPTSPLRDLNLQMRNGTDRFVNQNLVAAVNENDSSYTGNKTVNSGPGNDRIYTGSGDDNVNTGEGFDSSYAYTGNDTIEMGPKNDYAVAGPGTDNVSMGSGEDRVEEEPFPNGADVFNGGPDSDAISYYSVSPAGSGVTITLNGQPDDGHAGEGDNVNDFENLGGTEGADVLIGDGDDNSLSGGPGDDVLSAGAGDDRIYPGDGNDRAEGGEGNDYVEGEDEDEEGRDILSGGPGDSDLVEYFGRLPVTMTLNNQADDGRAGEGDNISGFEGLEGGDGADTIVGDAANNLLIGNGGNDTMTGGAGSDQLLGEGGDDVLLALGGRDEVGCGTGFDQTVHDADDQLNGDCERRGASVTSDSAALSGKGKAKVKLACPAEEGATCKGKLVLVSNGKQIGSGKFSVAKGKTGTATVKLTKKGRKALAKSGNTLLVSGQAQTTEPQGKSTNADQLELEGKAKGKKKKKKAGKGR
jgi:Ca2+-binding RTX toxin-like protein